MIGCRALTDQEVLLIEANFESIRDKALFILNVYTGFRIQESLSLRVKDVFENNKMSERITVQRKSMKGRISSRSVKAHDRVKALLYQLIKSEALEPNDYLFKSRKGFNQPISRIQAWKIFKGVARSLKLEGKLGLHSSRKRFADKMYKQFKGDIFKTSKALGHKHITSTTSYLSFKTEEIDEAIEGLE